MAPSLKKLDYRLLQMTLLMSPTTLNSCFNHGFVSLQIRGQANLDHEYQVKDTFYLVNIVDNDYLRGDLCQDRTLCLGGNASTCREGC